MRIGSIGSQCNYNSAPKQYANISFWGVNLLSPKLKFTNDDFFVRIWGYGKNKPWAEKIKETADLGADLIRRGTSPENVLKLISFGVKDAASFILDEEKRLKTGVLRTKRENWPYINKSEIVTDYESGRYSIYRDRFSHTCQNPLKKPYADISLSRPTLYEYIEHGLSTFINQSLNRVFKISSELFEKFIKEDVKAENMEEINSKVAEIRWILAHSSPWRRGSDAISNVYMRSMYKSMGIKTYPLKRGISLDLEAYCTNLDDYKKNFSNYFEKPPTLVET